MRKLQFTLFLLIQSIFVSAQFHYNFTSEPDSAKVMYNGVEKCITPCLVKYRWRDAVDGKLVFSVDYKGYKTWSDTIRKKPSYYDKSEQVVLKKDFPVFDLDSNPNLISFDKLIAQFKDETIIGKSTDLEGNIENIKWTGSVKVGDEIFESNFYTILTDMGYQSAYTENVKLFSNDTRTRPKLPRFTIGVEITDINFIYKEIKTKSYFSDNVISRASVEYKWSVLDKSSGKVTLEKANMASFQSRQNGYATSNSILETFELALINFLSSSEFLDLVKNSESNFIHHAVNKDSSLKSNQIPKIEVVKFNKTSDMIRHANKSCVTIITDGGHGSGVVISKSGLVLSAYHVVEGVNQIDVKFSSGLTLKAKIVDFDKFNDIVLLDINGDGFPALPLIKVGEETSLGEEVLTIGTPAELDLGQSISKGILSGKRKIEERVYLQTDIAVSPGNSGGPLLNMKGEIIGIVQKKIVGEGIEGIGFSVPMDKIRIQLGIIEK